MMLGPYLFATHTQSRVVYPCFDRNLTIVARGGRTEQAISSQIENKKNKKPAARKNPYYDASFGAFLVSHSWYGIYNLEQWTGIELNTSISFTSFH